jgi:hypothetical protein
VAYALMRAASRFRTPDLTAHFRIDRESAGANVGQATSLPYIGSAEFP